MNTQVPSPPTNKLTLYPAIDLINAQVVRLKQGEFDQQTTYPLDPIQLASQYQQAGAEWLHVVDLDAAKSGNSAGGGDNLQLISRICEQLQIKVQSGGGVRSRADIERRLQAGIQRVVVGSLAVTNSAELGEFLQEFGAQALTAALDVRPSDNDYVPAIAGWQQKSGRELFEVLDELRGYGLQHLLCTDISRDGMLQGPNTELYQAIQQRYPELQLQASGGVQSLDDLHRLRELSLAGAVIGKALLEGRFSLREALASMSVQSNLARRIIPCLDVKDGQVIKGVKFRDHQVVGEIEQLAAHYSEQGADELVFYDISASPQGRSVDIDWIRRVNQLLDIPFCVAGGIRDLDTAARVLQAGADKISINTPALQNPELINQLADRFGSQCVVVGIDSISDAGEYTIRQFTGDPDKMQAAGRRTLEWIIEVQQRGAGEIVLNCMDADGVRRGYDIAQLQQARQLCKVPLIASGGAGNASHFSEVFQQADVDGALAASVFHRGLLAIAELKQQLTAAGVLVRTIENLER